MSIELTLHHKNKHKNGYDFQVLCKTYPKLQRFIIKNKFNNQPTIDFSDACAVKTLNAALLASYYQIANWDIPKGYLCPPIPGRVDYIHHLAQLLATSLKDNSVSKSLLSQKVTSKKVTVLDIGTGASCIYPILGQREYKWHFVASDIDPLSIASALQIINKNERLADAIECRHQQDHKQIFKGIIKKGEFYHLTMCNPPFHKSITDAQQGTKRKWSNLNKGASSASSTLNFGGQKAELWCDGGELTFIQKMIKESIGYQQQVLWFTTLISKKDNIRPIKLALKKAKVANTQVIKMAQGNKISRFIAWTF
ncbi:MAG: 23S rRNA (adenine(1618)-N(6))-methyltransferase RlmF [Colwellia sp.]|nr:23S rRNA (adenine(1618)-N(6))-methyltransferase RlmF [Colwellia sp.]